MSNPDISIIIPTLQEARCIAQTLDQFTSTLRQQHRIEVIVSDGGSTDETIALAQSRADRVLEHSPEGGKQNISRGRNTGAAVARGTALIFLNADVIIEDPDKFLRLTSDAIHDRSVAGATCNVNIYPWEERLSDWIFHNSFNGYFWLLNVFGMGMGRGECHIIRKELFEKVGGYNEEMAAGEDYDLFLRLRRHGKIVFLRSLTVFESPRRFRKYGYVWISFLWFLNAIWVLLFHRSLMSDWKPVR